MSGQLPELQQSLSPLISNSMPSVFVGGSNTMGSRSLGLLLGMPPGFVSQCAVVCQIILMRAMITSSRNDQTTTLAKEGPLSNACSALLDEPPAPYSEQVAKEMRDRHQPPRTENIARWTLIALVSLASLTMVQEALLSFAPDSAAGPSGLRPQHIEGGLLPRYTDELMRSLHAVVRIMAEGNSPGSIVSWIASASLTALRKKDGRHPPVSVGETLRRLTANALLATASEDTSSDQHSRFGTRNGCEAIVQAIRRLVKHDDDGKR